MFDCGSDSSVFQTALLKKLQDTGMDTITYIMHPKDPKDMVSVSCKRSGYGLGSILRGDVASS
jgi:hypothetical protein